MVNQSVTGIKINILDLYNIDLFELQIYSISFELLFKMIQIIVHCDHSSRYIHTVHVLVDIPIYTTVHVYKHKKIHDPANTILTSLQSSKYSMHCVMF